MEGSLNLKCSRHDPAGVSPPWDPVGPCLRKEEAANEEWKAGRIAAPGNGDPELKVQILYNPTCDGEGKA